MPNFLENLGISQESFVKMPSEIFGTYRRTKAPHGLDTWSDTMYLTFRGFRPALNRTGYGAAFGDDEVRGYNASASSMTKLDGLFVKCLDQSSLILGIKDKDWDQGQKANLVDKMIGDVALLFYLRSQVQIFDKLLAPEEDSTFATGDELAWDWDDLDAEIRSLTSRKYPIFNVSLQLARLLTPIFKIGQEYPDRGFPPQYYKPYDHTVIDDTPSLATVANFRVLKGVMNTLSDGIIHAKKVSLPWKEFSLAMLDDAKTVYSIHSKVGMLYGEGASFTYYDGAAEQSAVPTGDFDGGNQTSKILPIDPSGNLDEIFALLPFIADRYDVANNPYAAVDPTQGTVVEDKANFGKIAYNGTVYTTPISFTELHELFPITYGAQIPMTKIFGAGDAAHTAIPRDFGHLIYPNHIAVSGISQTIFEDAFERKLIKLMCGEQLDLGQPAQIQAKDIGTKKVTNKR